MATTKLTYTFGTGRRKTAVARVRLKEGTGRILVNRRELADYFRLAQEQERVLSPLRAVNAEKAYDIHVNAEGGGISSQSGAITLGISRALRKVNPDYEPILREKKFLTRDSRQKERKKYGRRGARRGFQFSKR
ncbi:MAG: 30S ribosomal protein S9 [Gemmatimonadales bacterium]